MTTWAELLLICCIFTQVFERKALRYFSEDSWINYDKLLLHFTNNCFLRGTIVEEFAYHSFHNYCICKIIEFQELGKKIQSTIASFYVNVAQHTDLRLHRNNRKITLLARERRIRAVQKKYGWWNKDKSYSSLDNNFARKRFIFSCLYPKSSLTNRISIRTIFKNNHTTLFTYDSNIDLSNLSIRILRWQQSVEIFLNKFKKCWAMTQCISCSWHILTVLDATEWTCWFNRMNSFVTLLTLRSSVLFLVCNIEIFFLIWLLYTERT